MIKKIQSFDEFTGQKIEEANDSFFSFDFLGNLFTKGFDAFTDVLKNKATAYILKYLGIGENTILSQIVQQMVEQFEVKDYWGILFNGKADAMYLAPKAAKATQEFLISEGLDGIAEKLGVTDKNGYLFKTISEYIQNQTSTGDFQKTLENFYLGLFGSAPKNSAKDFVKGLTPGEKSKIEKDLTSNAKSSGIKIENQAERNSMLDNFFANLGSMNQANVNQISNTSGNDMFLDLVAPQQNKI